jgi:hypothetical protein
MLDLREAIGSFPIHFCHVIRHLLRLQVDIFAHYHS